MIEIKLYNSDCLKKLEQIKSESIDAVITDPPYASGGILQFASTKRDPVAKYSSTSKNIIPTFYGDRQDQISHFTFYILVLIEIHRVLKENAPVFMFTDWRQFGITGNAIQIADLNWRGSIVWDKGHCRIQQGYRQVCEYIHYGCKGKWTNKIYEKGYFKSPNINHSNREHLTQKPTDLLIFLLKSINKNNGMVLDPFMGSGSTGEACLQAGHSFIGIEKSKEYYNIANNRLKNKSGSMFCNFN